MKLKDIEKNEALEKLREFIKPGDTIYTTLKHVSKSGMMRVIDLFVIQDDEPRRITSLACRATKSTYNDKHEGMKMDGCGMDMGFAAVYDLSYNMFPNGFECIGETPVRCPSNDHSNGDRDYTPHMHSSGGYALKHRWM
jgi:hypothetical protein